MKLRSKLFLSSSALISLALIGLLLGIFGVLQLTHYQSRAMERDLRMIDATLGLRQDVARQIILLLTDDLDTEALQASRRSVENWLANAHRGDLDGDDRQALEELRAAYAHYDQLLSKLGDGREELLESQQFSRALDGWSQSISNWQAHYVAQMHASERNARHRAWLVATLLGLIGLAVLVIGFISANNMARRFGQPIEALARAADQIGKGDFQITLPISSAVELSALSRRFGLMAEALSHFKNSNVEALLAEQQRLQAVLDSIDDGLLIFDRNGLLEHLNPVAQRQLAWQGRQLGQTLGQALQQPELDEQLRRVLEGRGLDHAPRDLQIDAEGESRLLSYSLTPVSHGPHQTRGAVMVLHDVTEQRAFDRVRNEFVLRASHELRTPVTGMQMAFSLLRERLRFPEESREDDLLRTVDEEMHRLVQLINDLLIFSRYQNGLQKIEPAPCDLEEMLHQAQARFIGQASAKDIDLRVDIHDPLPRIHVDRPQIDRVLDNLLDNAVRHSPSQGQIRLQARRQSERLIISVEDNGEGIPYGQQARVFEPFVQVGRKKGGAGLGLALCKEIVQLHGGHIGVHSRPGQGAQFYLELPV